MYAIRSYYEPIIEELDVLINDPPTVKVYDPITNERFEYPIEMSSLGSVVTIDEDVEHISYQFVPVQIDTILSHIEQGLIEQGKYLDRTNAIEKFQDISQKRETGYFIVRHNGFQYKAKPGETRNNFV